jgi:hypothetical protein
LTVLTGLSLCVMAKPLLPALQASCAMVAEGNNAENPGATPRGPQVCGIATDEPALVEAQAEPPPKPSIAAAPPLRKLLPRQVAQTLGPSPKPVAVVVSQAESPEASAPAGNDLAGRGEKLRRQMLAQYGGSDHSEAAVMAALKWLAEHQLSDGSWSLQHQTHPHCHGQCGNPGTMLHARVAATSLALLPFLGAGNTHQEGHYKQTVRGGVYYLLKHMRLTPAGAALNEPSGAMYSHGLASIALCEAYAMSHDKALANGAQLAVKFICYAQDPVGGGWRYQPQTPGDTSVTGWQLMALKSARMADLLVPQPVFAGASRFLDSMQTEEGARYGYTSAGSQPTMTAIGLLCRMYLGWQKENPALRQGIEDLAARGPSTNDLYYAYYATQVMRQWGGPAWQKWNDGMRDPLIALQSAQGHETGSWFIDKGEVGSRVGGRLYCTCLAAMILEVYYRHMPLYSRRSTNEAF